MPRNSQDYWSLRQIGPNLRISFNTSNFWIGLDWVRIFRQLYGLDWIHELMDWIGLGWVRKNGPMSNSALVLWRQKSIYFGSNIVVHRTALTNNLYRNIVVILGDRRKQKLI